MIEHHLLHTLNPKPGTRFQESSPIYFKPQTPNPKPQTPNPTPGSRSRARFTSATWPLPCSPSVRFVGSCEEPGSWAGRFHLHPLSTLRLCQLCVRHHSFSTYCDAPGCGACPPPPRRHRLPLLSNQHKSLAPPPSTASIQKVCTNKQYIYI